jgi:3-oxoacyl-[acyl-carrier protein] reductase
LTRLAGKRCLITGGSRGLGRAMAVTFAREGARVAFTYSTHEADAAEAARLVTAAGLGQAPRVFKGSVADAAHCKATVDALAREWGGLDVLVNCAGVTQVLPISLLEEADWDLVMDVNVKGAYLMSRAALRHMIRQKAGVVLMVGNFASERVIEAPVHYAASKSALRGFTEALAREVGRHGIRVNLVAPGLLDVGMALALPQHRQDEFARRSPLGRAGRADEVAAAAAFLCSDGAALVSGAKVTLDGGL